MQKKEIIPLKFIYRTTRRDFKVIEIGDIRKINMVDYDYVINLKKLDLMPQLEGRELYECLNSRGWIKITTPINFYEAADIERICYYGKRTEQNFFYNRQGEFNLVAPDQIIDQKKNCPDENYWF